MDLSTFVRATIALAGGVWVGAAGRPSVRFGLAIAGIGGALLALMVPLYGAMCDGRYVEVFVYLSCGRYVPVAYAFIVAGAVVTVRALARR